MKHHVGRQTLGALTSNRGEVFLKKVLSVQPFHREVIY